MYWCPDCKCELRCLVDGFECTKCNNVYRLKNGFCVFDDSELVNTLDYGLDKLKLDIENKELVTKLHRYILPNIGSIEGRSILSVGCGAGSDIEELNRLGAEAYGMDFAYRARQWGVNNYNKHWLFVSSSDRIPFPVEYFDLIFCFGVIEHVSEELAFKKNYASLDRERRLFLKDLFDVLKPGGMMIITSPNRNFPLDFQHNAYGWLNFLSRLSIYAHSPFTRFLESYYSLTHHFRRIGKNKVEPMPLVNFFGFNVFKLSPKLSHVKRFFDVYIKILDNMPNVFRKSFLNPYIVLKVIKLQ